MELRWQRGPSEVLYGRGSAEFLKGARRSRTALIADRALAPFGPLGQVSDWLAANRAPLTRIEFRAEPGEPSCRTADQAGERLRAFEPDLVVAVGGGSAIEWAKAAWALYEHPGLDGEALLRSPALPGLRTRARFIALPTTHGSGAEGSPTLGLFRRGRFCGLRSPSLIPDRAILDPNLLAGLPRGAAAAAGFDALAHAVEALLSTLPGPLADVQALAAVPRLLSDLPRAVLDPEDARARESVLYAAFLAGTAAGNRHLGLAHALADALGPRLGISHGAALAGALPGVVRFNAESSADRATGLAGAAGADDLEGLAARLEAFRAELGLPERLPAPAPDDVDALAGEILASPHLRTNPRPVTAEEVRRILEEGFPGR